MRNVSRVSLFLCLLALVASCASATSVVGSTAGGEWQPLRTAYSTSFFEQLVRQLDVPLAGRRIWSQVHVLSAGKPNAFAGPNGEVAVTRRMRT